MEKKEERDERTTLKVTDSLPPYSHTIYYVLAHNVL